jgi:peroxiredoxin
MGSVHLGSHYLSLPNLGVQHLAANTNASKTIKPNVLIGKPAPDFSLTDTDGKTVRTADLLGRPTIITVTSMWSPTTTEQMTALSHLQANPDVNVVPVALQDTLGRVQAYTAIADLKLRWLVDPNSSLSTTYNVRSLPTHYFIDRKGEVRSVVAGVLSERQIKDELSRL